MQTIKTDSLTNEEKISVLLGELFQSFGYVRYSMTKFEEYSLYGENKDFLSNGNVITFLSGDGKMLALRPDVTLSILKNTNATRTNSEKVFYIEKVYRYDKETKSFKEISQAGVEMLGNVDRASIAEIVVMALNSLAALSDDFVLDISNISFVKGMFDGYDIDISLRRTLTKFLKDKNLHEVDNLVSQNMISDEFASAFKTLISISDKPVVALGKMKKLIVTDEMQKAYDEMKELFDVLSSGKDTDKIRIDFSVESDFNYYTDIVFCGYIAEMPKAVLKGGRYDALAYKMKKDIGALGFAVYVGDAANVRHSKPKAITVILSDGDTKGVFEAAQKLRAKGERVRIARNMPKDVAICKVYRYEAGKLTEVKND